MQADAHSQYLNATAHQKWSARRGIGLLDDVGMKKPSMIDNFPLSGFGERLASSVRHKLCCHQGICRLVPQQLGCPGSAHAQLANLHIFQ